MKAKPKSARSRYEITLGALDKRLSSSALPKSARAVLLGQLEHLREPDFALWLDAPYEKIDRRELETDSARAAVIAFAAPVTLSGPLILRHDEILGVRVARDLTLYVFLEPVRARDVCVVPDTLAIFARGLTVERLASFDAPDSHTEIAERFEAPYVLANLSGGGVFVEKGAVVSVGAYAQKIPGLPKDAKTVKHASLRSMLPFLRDGAEDEDVWSVALDLAKSADPFPAAASKKSASRTASKPAKSKAR